jgi:hypothetical protein|tara:strand:- start:1239 stop:1673 length:435 start_codon:yes stop_codon:yes gene_type:complete
MASRVDFAVSATPVVTVAAGENVEVDTIAADVNRSLGGSGSVACTWGTTVGYTAGDPAHAIVTSATSLGTFSSVKFVFIKHSGFEEDALTTATTSTLSVMESGNQFAVLAAGDAIILPFAVADTPVLTGTSSSGAIAVEVMATP